MVHDAGYATDPQWSNKIINIGDGVDGVNTSGSASSLAPAASGRKGVQSVVDTGSQSVGTRPTFKTAMNQSQFGDPQLSSAEAYSACGPAAAVRFAQTYGRNPSLREATDIAKTVGWSSGQGMAGIGSEQKLLQKMGVDTRIVGPDWNAYAQEVSTGNPITISTPGHYYYADDYNAESGAFHVGRSGTDLKGGSEWMTPTQMESRMGAAQGALFATNPVSDRQVA